MRSLAGPSTGGAAAPPPAPSPAEPGLLDLFAVHRDGAEDEDDQLEWEAAKSAAPLLHWSGPLEPQMRRQQQKERSGRFPGPGIPPVGVRGTT